MKISFSAFLINFTKINKIFCHLSFENRARHAKIDNRKGKCRDKYF